MQLVLVTSTILLLKEENKHKSKFIDCEHNKTSHPHLGGPYGRPVFLYSVR